MTLGWIACGAALVAVGWYLPRRRQLRCYLCAKRMRGAERSAHYAIDGRRRVVCGRCDDVNLTLTSVEAR